ncbi:MAG: tyrosine-type recombinase/integrase [Planctomycetales bacterium]|nr:tyrosine-type recombinase/integrase [Planctomycetales bacterium]
MPKLIHAIPRYRKHRASGQAVVTLSGIDHYLGPHGTAASRREYDRLVGEWLARDRRTLRGDSQTTVAMLLAAYWKHAKRYYRTGAKSTGEIEALKVALRPLKRLYAVTPADDFGPLALCALREQLISEGRSRTGINQAIGRIRRVFKWGVAQQLVSPEVWHALQSVDGLRQGRTAAKETEPVRPIDDATVDATLKHASDVVGDMVRLQRLTGARPTEICDIRPCDIDRTGDVWLYRPESHKNSHRGKDRVIPLGKRAQGILLRRLARDSEAYCFSPADAEAKRRAVQHAQRKTPLSCGNAPGRKKPRKTSRTIGGRYDVNSYRRAIHRACDAAGVPRWSPNRLRHAAATQVRKQFGLEAAQLLLGHAQADVTEIYAERDTARAVEIARIVG